MRSRAEVMLKHRTRSSRARRTHVLAAGRENGNADLAGGRDADASDGRAICAASGAFPWPGLLRSGFREKPRQARTVRKSGCLVGERRVTDSADVLRAGAGAPGVRDREPITPRRSPRAGPTRPRPFGSRARYTVASAPSERHTSSQTLHAHEVMNGQLGGHAGRSRDGRLRHPAEDGERTREPPETSGGLGERLVCADRQEPAGDDASGEPRPQSAIPEEAGHGDAEQRARWSASPSVVRAGERALVRRCTSKGGAAPGARRRPRMAP